MHDSSSFSCYPAAKCRFDLFLFFTTRCICIARTLLLQDDRRLSVTRYYCMETAKLIIKLFSAVVQISRLIYLPRKDERLSRPGWLTYSGRFTHLSAHPSATGRAQDSESSPKVRQTLRTPRDMRFLCESRTLYFTYWACTNKSVK